jgi:hypothetical protein
MLSPSRSIEASFGPILAEPTVVDTNATTTAALLTADLSDAQHHTVRRVMIYNRDNTNDVTLLIKPRGTNFATSGLTAADGLRVPPYQFRQVVVSSAFGLGVVSSSGTVAFNALITDV